MGFGAYLIEKMQGLVAVHYQLYSNAANYLIIFQTGWTFLDCNLDEVYNMTTSILKLILLIVSNWKLPNLLHL